MTKNNTSKSQPDSAKPMLVVRACVNCKYSEKHFNTDLYCMNAESDIELSGKEADDNYMGVVEENHVCGLFEA